MTGLGPVTSSIRSRSLGSHLTGASTGYQFGQMGSVASMVAGFNSGRPLPAIPNLVASDSSARRHGLAERGSGRRERSPRPASWRSGRTNWETQETWRTGRTAYEHHRDRTERAVERARAIDDLGPEMRSDFDEVMGGI